MKVIVVKLVHFLLFFSLLSLLGTKEVVKSKKIGGYPPSLPKQVLTNGSILSFSVKVSKKVAVTSFEVFFCRPISASSEDLLKEKYEELSREFREKAESITDVKLIHVSLLKKHNAPKLPSRFNSPMYKKDIHFVYSVSREGYEEFFNLLVDSEFTVDKMKLNIAGKESISSELGKEAIIKGKKKAEFLADAYEGYSLGKLRSISIHSNFYYSNTVRSGNKGMLNFVPSENFRELTLTASFSYRLEKK